MLGGGGNDARAARSVVRSQTTRSLPETQRLCAVTAKTAVHVAVKFRITKCHNRPQLFFLELSGLTSAVIKITTENIATER